jgi:hypothetical protein
MRILTLCLLLLLSGCVKNFHAGAVIGWSEDGIEAKQTNEVKTKEGVEA